MGSKTSSTGSAASGGGGSGSSSSDSSVRVWDVMRSKNFLILLLFMLATSISLWLVSMPTPNIRNIMTETHKHISHLKENMNVMSSSRELKVDETYLELLGFTSHPRLYPESTSQPGFTLPVIVTSVTSRNYQNAFDTIDSVKKYVHKHHILIFDLGLSSYELVKLKKHCNTSTSCMVKSFDFDKFPGHLRNMEIKAYKPVAIQEALNEYGAVIWTESPEYFITSNLTSALKLAASTGIAAWTIESAEPTSALTHPKMFAYFETEKELFYFHHMVGSEHLVLYNTRRVHSQFMLRWVECALAPECISPMGAQNSGCKYQRKPRYRYTGCHRYELSALNVILGLIFNYDNEHYTVRQNVFGIEPKVELTTTAANGTERQAGRPTMTRRSQELSRRLAKAGDVVGGMSEVPN